MMAYVSFSNELEECSAMEVRRMAVIYKVNGSSNCKGSFILQKWKFNAGKILCRLYSDEGQALAPKIAQINQRWVAAEKFTRKKKIRKGLQL